MRDNPEPVIPASYLSRRIIRQSPYHVVEAGHEGHGHQINKQLRIFNISQK